MLIFALHIAQAQKTGPPPQPRETLDVDHIISEFTSGETEFLQEFGRYGYTLEFDVQSIRNGKVVDEYFRVSQIGMSKSGKIEEKMLKFVMPRSTDLLVTREDLDDLRGPYQFALQSSNANQYKFVYVGKEHIGNLDLYVFDVTPISLSSTRRLFRGRVWVGVDSLRIVKTLGKFEQKGDQSFPVMEIYRDTVDSRFLFPAGGSGDDKLVFPGGQSTHLRLSVRYMNYVKLK